MVMAAQGTRGAANGVEVYQYLESLNIKPAAVNANGENALHYIARKPNQAAVTNYFLSKGVSVNQPDKEGNTPFMIAASFNRDTAMVALFLLNAKNINGVNKKGMSALTMAVRNNSTEVVQLLVTKGADVKVVDAEGNNLAYYLVQSYNPQGGGQEPNRQGGGAPAGGGQRPDAFGTKMKILQDNGFTVTTPQKDGNTLYHLAVAKNDLTLLKKIEPLHVDVNAINKEGLTPLQKAAMIAKDDSILKYFLSIGAKKELTTEFKETAYDLAKENEFLTKNNTSVDFLK
jgi:ankyrin repeat protein